MKVDTREKYDALQAKRRQSVLKRKGVGKGSYLTRTGKVRHRNEEKDALAYLHLAVRGIKDFNRFKPNHKARAISIDSVFPTLSKDLKAPEPVTQFFRSGTRDAAPEPVDPTLVSVEEVQAVREALMELKKVELQNRMSARGLKFNTKTTKAQMVEALTSE